MILSKSLSSNLEKSSPKNNENSPTTSQFREGIHRFPGSYEILRFKPTILPRNRYLSHPQPIVNENSYEAIDSRSSPKNGLEHRR